MIFQIILTNTVAPLIGMRNGKSAQCNRSLSWNREEIGTVTTPNDPDGEKQNHQKKSQIEIVVFSFSLFLIFVRIQRVVEREGKLESGESRLGKEFYKSEAEINAIKAANKATETINDVSSTVTNSLPDVRSLSGDWRFWIGILVLVSVGFSVLTAPPVNIVPTSSPESFYM